MENFPSVPVFPTDPLMGARRRFRRGLSEPGFEACLAEPRVILWRHCADGRVKATADTIAKSLVGDYRREHLFTLGQSLEAFRHYQELIGACDREIAQLLETFESKVDPPEGSLPESQDGQKPSGGGPRFDLQSHLYRIFGVDLTRLPGINVLTTQTLLAEIGPDLASPARPRLRPGSDFVRTIGLAGEKCCRSKHARSRNRAATALRMAAQSLHRSQTYLGHFYRRMRVKLGAPKAITATAHKLARIIYHMVTTRHAYDETICVQN